MKIFFFDPRGSPTFETTDCVVRIFGRYCWSERPTYSGEFSFSILLAIICCNIYCRKFNEHKNNDITNAPMLLPFSDI